MSVRADGTIVDYTPEMAQAPALAEACVTSVIAPGGFEHSSDPRGKVRSSSTGGTESGTPGDGSAGNRQAPDPELAEIAQAWPGLPVVVKAGILAMVKASKA